MPQQLDLSWSIAIRVRGYQSEAPVFTQRTGITLTLYGTLRKIMGFRAQVAMVANARVFHQGNGVPG
ncbi:MAG: hypothetical protein AMXMBFR84_40250 [Candidatus Hydrogenedentota bacterium]